MNAVILGRHTWGAGHNRLFDRQQGHRLPVQRFKKGSSVLAVLTPKTALRVAPRASGCGLTRPPLPPFTHCGTSGDGRGILGRRRAREHGHPEFLISCFLANIAASGVLGFEALAAARKRAAGDIIRIASLNTFGNQPGFLIAWTIQGEAVA